MAHHYNLVIRGGTIVDGTGAAPFEGDVAVAGGKIIEVGKVSGRGVEEIDAHGLLVTPGFVDIHTHYDGQATWDSQVQPSAFHGVTTAVMGNCGVGFAPVRAQDRNGLIELMEGVEDIPGITLHEGLKWNWESFDDYLDVLDSRRRDVDIGAQLPHAALRVYVMGERAMRLEPATPDDIARMRKLAEKAMRAGAIGFSTSRTINHQTLKGDLTPSLRAAEDELIGIALGMKDAGHGVIELLSDFDQPDVETEFALLRRIVERSGRPLSFTVVTAATRPGIWRTLLKLIGEARAEGLPIRGQHAPRSPGFLFGLQTTLNPFTFCRSYAAIDGKPLAEKLAIMRDPSFRAKLLTEDRLSAIDTLVDQKTDYRVRLARYAGMFDRTFILGTPPNYEQPKDRTIASIAERRGVSPLEIICDAMLENDGKGLLYCAAGNYDNYALDVYGAMIADPNTVLGLGDAGAHVGSICDASFPTYLLSHWGRDRAHGRFDIPTLIKRLTSSNAKAVELSDRGIIAPGMKADLNIIDFDKLRLESPFMAYDLPAGGRRLLQKATGYAATILSGEITYRHGEATGALPGRLVRGMAS